MQVESSDPRLRAVALPFFTSGLAALTYQVCWQRLLFTAFGVDLQSITVIVSAFMLGLGLGAVVGGRLADRYPASIPRLFAATEFAIGLFGLLSVRFIGGVAGLTAGEALPLVFLANFVLLLVPTALMGATLPMLVAFLVQRNANVGVSIGALYFINTLGAAFGSAAVGFVAFHHLDIEQTLRVAAVLNFLAGALVLALFRRARP